MWSSGCHYRSRVISPEIGAWCVLPNEASEKERLRSWKCHISLIKCCWCSKDCQSACGGRRCTNVLMRTTTVRVCVCVSHPSLHKALTTIVCSPCFPCLQCLHKSRASHGLAMHPSDQSEGLPMILLTKCLSTVGLVKLLYFEFLFFNFQRKFDKSKNEQRTESLRLSFSWNH